MMIRLAFATVALVLGAAVSGTATVGLQTEDAAAAEVRAVLGRYVKAVNDADETAIGELWTDTSSVSYINPMQRLHSAAELRQFWQGFLGKGFTRRELKPQNVLLQVSGDMAWAAFEWEFTATRADGKPYRSHGWETQVYRRTARGWRIAHVHYSVPAAPAQ